MLLSTNQHQLNFHKKNVLIFKSRMLQTYDILFPARHKLKSDFKYPPGNNTPEQLSKQDVYAPGMHCSYVGSYVGVFSVHLPGRVGKSRDDTLRYLFFTFFTRVPG